MARKREGGGEAFPLESSKSRHGGILYLYAFVYDSGWEHLALAFDPDPNPAPIVGSRFGDEMYETLHTLWRGQGPGYEVDEWLEIRDAIAKNMKKLVKAHDKDIDAIVAFHRLSPEEQEAWHDGQRGIWADQQGDDPNHFQRALAKIEDETGVEIL